MEMVTLLRAAREGSEFFLLQIDQAANKSNGRRTKRVRESGHGEGVSRELSVGDARGMC